VRFWLSALIAVLGSFALAYLWVRWPRSRWPRSSLTNVGADPLASLKTIVEISAVLIAGIWTYDHFLRVDEPTLQTNITVDAEFERDEALSSPQCLLLVNTTVKNIGKADLTITRVVQTLWRIRDDLMWVPHPPDRFFVNVERLLSDEKAFPKLDSVTFEKGESLAYHYAPDASATFAFPWVLSDMPATDTVVVRFNFDIDKKPLVDFKFTWGKPCAPKKPTEAAAPAK
jgi:hypothetical protein